MQTSEGPGAVQLTSLITSLVRYRATVIFLLLILTGIGLLWWSTTPSSGPNAALGQLLGTVLVPAALVSFIFELFLRRTLLMEMRSQLAASLRDEMTILREVEEAGFRQVYPDFPLEYVTKSFENAFERVRILANWFPNTIQIEHSLVTAARRGSEIQVILLNPQSAHAKDRAGDLGYDDLNTVPREIRASLNEIGRFLEKEGVLDKVQVRLHDFTPTHILFAWDNTVLFGVFLVGVHALQGPFFEFAVQNSGTGHLLLANFEKMWPDAQPYIFSPSEPIPQR